MYVNETKLETAPVVVRQPVALEVVQFTQNLNQRAALLVTRMNEKLHPVMVSEYPRECVTATQNSVEYPPLFADLRANLQCIEAALDTIEYMLSRTEL